MLKNLQVRSTKTKKYRMNYQTIMPINFKPKKVIEKKEKKLLRRNDKKLQKKRKTNNKKKTALKWLEWKIMILINYLPRQPQLKTC